MCGYGLLLGVGAFAILCCVLEDSNDGPGTSIRIVSRYPANEYNGPYYC